MRSVSKLCFNLKIKIPNTLVERYLSLRMSENYMQRIVFKASDILKICQLFRLFFVLSNTFFLIKRELHKVIKYVLKIARITSSKEDWL